MSKTERAKKERRKARKWATKYVQVVEETKDCWPTELTESSRRFAAQQLELATIRGERKLKAAKAARKSN